MGKGGFQEVFRRNEEQFTKILSRAAKEQKSEPEERRKRRFADSILTRL
jgi:hypothetical protein